MIRLRTSRKFIPGGGKPKKKKNSWAGFIKAKRPTDFYFHYYLADDDDDYCYKKDAEQEVWAVIHALDAAIFAMAIGWKRISAGINSNMRWNE